jgi:hypothetical protein
LWCYSPLCPYSPLCLRAVPPPASLLLCPHTSVSSYFCVLILLCPHTTALAFMYLCPHVFTHFVKIKRVLWRKSGISYIRSACGLHTLRMRPTESSHIFFTSLYISSVLPLSRLRTLLASIYLASISSLCI